MFSVMMMPMSATSPMAMARPASDMMFESTPKPNMRMKQRPTDSGNVTSTDTVTVVDILPAWFEYVSSSGNCSVAGSAANGVIIVAGKDSGINTLADLKGKRVASPQLANTQDIAAKHYLKFKLGQDNVDNVIAVQNAEQSGLLARGDHS